MEMKVDVTEMRSRKADTGLSAADSSVGSGNVNSEINDNTLTSESSPRQHTDNVRNDNEESSRSTNDELRPRASDSGNAARERSREDIIATNSSRATPIADREVESSKGADGRPSAPHTPLAFTIDFGNNKEVDTAKYQNLFERYNARHRRNLSTSKVLKILSFFYIT